MKIAICLSGHFKLYNRIYENFLEYLYYPLSKLGKVDVFISTWDKLSTNYSFSSFNGDCPPELGITNSADIQEKYLAKFIEVVNFEHVKHLFNYRRFFNEDKPYKFYDGLIQENIFIPAAMFYQWKLCDELKRKEELNNNFTYDLVVKMRPDIFFLREPDLTNIDPNIFYFRNLCSDFFCISSSKNISFICDSYNHIERIIKAHFNEHILSFLPYCSEYFLENRYNEISLSLDKRKELGNDLFFFYPRKYFIASCYEALKKVGREDELYGIISKYQL